MKKIYLVRHCSASGQHKDSPLTTEGMRQAQLLSIFFSDNNFPIDRIISSPYLRAIESIKPYSEKTDIKIEIDDRLRERILSDEPVGDWLEILEHSFNNHDYYLPGGESAKAAIERANQVLQNIYDSNDVANIAIITHGNLLALIIQQYDNSFGFDKWKEIQNPDVFLINYDNGVESIEPIWKN